MPDTSSLRRPGARAARAIVAVLYLLLGFAGSPQSGSAAGVTLADANPANASSCDSGTASSTFLFLSAPFKVGNPAGAATGDVLLLTLRSANETNFFGSFTMPDAQLVRWTPLLSSGSTRTYYRVRLATDPGQYTLVSGLAFGTASADLTAVITAFSGADTVAPLANAGAQASGTGLGTGTLPDAAVVRGGSLRYSTVATDRSNTFDYSTSAPLAESCHEQTGNASITGAYEAGLGPTTTPTHTMAIGGSANPSWWAATYVIQPALSPCKGGGLTLTEPSAITFPATTLNGLDQTVTTTATFTVTDLTGLLTGWSLSGTSTTFLSGVHALATNAMSITGVTATPGTGNCSMPVNLIGFPLTLPAGLIAPAASKLFNAGLLSGAGPVNLAVGLKLKVPASTHVGTYSSNWTMTLAAGP
ncbi:MAG: hypothetical protein AAGC46_11220 [Solirubrobacteraceae bacterium]